MKLLTRFIFCDKLAKVSRKPLIVLCFIVAIWILPFARELTGFDFQKNIHPPFLERLLVFPICTWYLIKSIISGYWPISIPILFISILVIERSFHRIFHKNAAEQDAAANP